MNGLRYVNRIRNEVAGTFVTGPEVIQVEDTTICNVHCVYCNPQTHYDLPRGHIDPEIIQRFLKELEWTGWAKGVNQFRPFMNGDPLMSKNLPDLLYLGRKYLPNARIILLSNGALPDKVDRLLDPRIDIISLTVSAATRETYLKIHGADGFNGVLESFKRIMAEKQPYQKVHVSFIACPLNLKELPAWRETFAGAIQDVSPIHYSKGQEASLRVLDEGSNMEVAKTLATLCTPNKLRRYYACNCYQNQSIGLNGEYLHCCDLPYRFNFGRVGEIPFKTVWKKRLTEALRSSGCQSCNLKRSNWEEIVNRVH